MLHHIVNGYVVQPQADQCNLFSLYVLTSSSHSLIICWGFYLEPGSQSFLATYIVVGMHLAFRSCVSLFSLLVILFLLRLPEYPCCNLLAYNEKRGKPLPIFLFPCGWQMGLEPTTFRTTI